MANEKNDMRITSTSVRANGRFDTSRQREIHPRDTPFVFPKISQEDLLKRLDKSCFQDASDSESSLSSEQEDIPCIMVANSFSKNFTNLTTKIKDKKIEQVKAEAGKGYVKLVTWQEKKRDECLTKKIQKTPNDIGEKKIKEGASTGGDEVPGTSRETKSSADFAKTQRKINELNTAPDTVQEMKTEVAVKPRIFSTPMELPTAESDGAGVVRQSIFSTPLQLSEAERKHLEERCMPVGKETWKIIRANKEESQRIRIHIREQRKRDFQERKARRDQRKRAQQLG